MGSIQRIALLSLTGALLAVAGCGGKPTGGGASQTSPKFGMHGGPVVTFPGGQAAEVTFETEGPKSLLVAYFYGSESLDAPPSAAPTDVRIDLATPEGQSLSVTLSPSGSDAVAKRFASAPGDYVTDPMSGTLHASFDGQAASVPFFSGQN